MYCTYTSDIEHYILSFTVAYAFFAFTENSSPLGNTSAVNSLPYLFASMHLSWKNIWNVGKSGEDTRSRYPDRWQTSRAGDRALRRGRTQPPRVLSTSAFDHVCAKESSSHHTVIIIGAVTCQIRDKELESKDGNLCPEIIGGGEEFGGLPVGRNAAKVH